jgi:hypothetical protein
VKTGLASDAQFRRIFQLLDQLGIDDRDERRGVIARAIAASSSPTNDLTAEHANRMIRALEDKLYADPTRLFEGARVLAARRKSDLIAALSSPPVDADDRVA